MAFKFSLDIHYELCSQTMRVPSTFKYESKKPFLEGSFMVSSILFNQQDGQLTWPAGIGNIFLIPITLCSIVTIATSVQFVNKLSDG